MPFPDLGQAATERFLSLLPPDIRSVAEEDLAVSRPPSDALMTIARATSPAAASELCRKFGVEVRDMGRARRLRILAWLASDPDRRSLFRMIQSDGEGDGNGASAGGVQEVDVPSLFRDDVSAFTSCLAARVARAYLTETPAALAQRAAMDVAISTPAISTPDVSNTPSPQPLEA